MSDYESLLLSLTYLNSASEPTSGNRSVSITLSDGVHQDVAAVIIIVILSNDNPLSLVADTQTLTFTEGDAAIDVGRLSGVTLVDADRDSMVHNLTITLTGSLEEGRESLVVDSSVLGGGLTPSVLIQITQSSSLQSYQVNCSRIEYLKATAISDF